jgi:hypothetical protein
MLRAILIASVCVALPSIPAAQAQQAATAASGEHCQNQASRRRRSSVFGNIAGRALGRVGVPSSVAGVAVPTESLLSEAIMGLLDCREQQQAAASTNEAIRGGVGTRTSWQSESRPNVSGASTADSEERLADSTHCMTVTSIVIINGEETRAPQRLCRAPGARGYARV